MKTYRLNVLLQVEVDAWEYNDAREAVEDAFGPGDSAGLVVKEFGVVDYIEIESEPT